MTKPSTRNIAPDPISGWSCLGTVGETVTLTVQLPAEYSAPAIQQRSGEIYDPISKAWVRFGETTRPKRDVACPNPNPFV